MTRRPFLTFALLALSSFPSSLASITRDQLLLDPWQNYADPFNLTFTISDDLTLNVDISTVKTAPDSLIAIGGGANDSMANRELTVSAGFHNTGPISEFLMGDWDVKGNLVVTEGLTAKVDMAAYWGFDGSDEVSRSLALAPSCFLHTIASFSTVSGARRLWNSWLNMQTGSRTPPGGGSHGSLRQGLRGPHEQHSRDKAGILFGPGPRCQNIFYRIYRLPFPLPV